MSVDRDYTQQIENSLSPDSILDLDDLCKSFGCTRSQCIEKLLRWVRDNPKVLAKIPAVLNTRLQTVSRERFRDKPKNR